MKYFYLAVLAITLMFGCTSKNVVNNANGNLSRDTEYSIISKDSSYITHYSIRDGDTAICSSLSENWTPDTNKLSR